MIRVLVAGAAGRMGKAITRVARGSQELELAGGLIRPGEADAAELEPLFEDATAALEKMHPQVMIDFTAPEASVAHARLCAKRKVAFVCGTTGFLPEQRAELAEASRSIPVVLAPNMSVGVNVMFKVAGELARRLGAGFDAEVVEVHHRHKKDAPSGTALRLAEEIALATGRTRADLRFAREGQIGERPKKEIGVQTLRGGDVVGEHTAFFFGEGERLELTHRAASRDQFAQGAVRAATWVASQPPGLYDMQDVLGLRARE